MEILNPTITIQNTDQQRYLVRIQHDFGNGEKLDVTVLTPHTDQTLSGLSLQALDRLAALCALIRPAGS